MVGNKVTVGAPFYNRVAVPIGLFLLFLTGVGPLLPWRATSLKSIRRNFVLPVAVLWVAVLACLAAGIRPWKDGAFDGGSFYALVAFAISAGVLTAILSEFFPRSPRHLQADRAQPACGYLSARPAATPAATAVTSSTRAWS